MPYAASTIAAGIFVLLSGTGAGLAVYLAPLPWGERAAIAMAAVVGITVIGRFSRGLARLWLVGLMAAGIVLLLRWVPQPSNEREWQLPQSRIPQARISGARVQLEGFRNFRYASDGAIVEANWETRHFNLDQLENAWLGVSPFGSVPGIGHVFASFGFADGQYLAISVEARRERGERYGPVAGLFRNYELIYVVGDERDIIGLRTQVWGDDVYLYPVAGSLETKRAVLRDMFEHMNRLAEQAEFYDTVFNSCSSNLARHVNQVNPGVVPLSIKLVLAGFADELADDQGLLAIDGDLESVKPRYRINDRAAGALDAGFSERIRAAQ